jgi:capsular exopolysaccharide synthesis family protein
MPLAEALPGERRYEFSGDLVTLTDARPSEAEAIRTVRTHIVARHIEDGRRGLAVCATTKGAGCTFTAVNLAVALAQVGIATLLIDGDLRAPQVEDFIRPQTLTGGLRQCIGDEGLLPSDVIHAEPLPNLSVLYSGGIADNPQELLAGESFRRLIDRCLRDFEFTIIDTPPTNRCADARRISSVIGYSLIVAKSNVSMMGDVAQLASKLQDDHARVIGTVLNEV